MDLAFQAQVFLYDFSVSAWTALAPMQERRTYHGCGLVVKNRGAREVVVAGGAGSKSVEIYNLETQSWR